MGDPPVTPASEVRALRRAVKHLRFSLRWLLRRYDADAGDKHPARFHAVNVLENTRRWLKRPEGKC